jgi:hypothetical protein
MHSRSCTCHLRLLGDSCRPLRRRQVGKQRAAPQDAGGASRVTHGGHGGRAANVASRNAPSVTTGGFWPLDRPPHAHLGERGERAVKTTTHMARAR